MNRICAALCTLSLAGYALSVQAEEYPHPAFWQIQTSAYTHHFHYNPEHNDQQKLLAVEYNDDSNWLLGGAAFRNSFDQPSHYLYAGKRFDSHFLPVYLKLTGGLLHGYHGEYQDKIPLNHYGVAPAIIPSLGVHLGPATAELTLLGNAALMLNVGWRL